MKTKKLSCGSAYTGKLPRGCIHCGKGAKMVLMVTGRCSERCWYCPLSQEKKGRNVTFANERRVMNDEDIIAEAKSIDAEGTGMTGGDPLISTLTPRYIALLKSEFGEGHHIHLYTSTTELDRIRIMEEEGLDEIRFHPPFDIWKNIENTEFLPLMLELRDYNMDVGLEVPSIPGMQDQLKHLIQELGPYIDFINLNELEFSSTNWKALTNRGLRQAGSGSSAVIGSGEAAAPLLELGLDIPIHFCTSSFKDAVQLRNRIKRRCRNTAKKGDIITDEGLLIRGIILCDEPRKIVSLLKKEYAVPSKMVWYDDTKERVEICLEILEQIHHLLPYDCFGIEEYPTADRLEVERWPLER
ncbi:MAG: radical SAM protein [Thermoplasmata archaeon]